MKEVKILNCYFSVAGLLLLKPNVQSLLDEYFSDPNCWPALWIQNEANSVEDEAAFIYLAVNDERYDPYMSKRITVKY